MHRQRQQFVTTDEDTPVTGNVIGQDVDGDSLSYTVSTIQVMVPSALTQQQVVIPIPRMPTTTVQTALK
jgi:hypothetical protein